MYNSKTKTFTKLTSKIQKQLDKIQGNKISSLQEKRDESCKIFLENGVFGSDIYELKNKSHMTSWYIRRNKVLAYYGDTISTQQRETRKRGDRIYGKKWREGKTKKTSLTSNIIKGVFGRKK